MFDYFKYAEETVSLMLTSTKFYLHEEENFSLWQRLWQTSNLNHSISGTKRNT